MILERVAGAISVRPWVDQVKDFSILLVKMNTEVLISSVICDL